MRSAPTRCSTSTSFPKRIVIAGGGYIANEFAGIFHQFGSHVTLVNRTDVILRHYDQQIVDRLLQISLRKGIDFRFNATIDRIEQREDGTLHISMTGCDDIEADAAAVRGRPQAEHRGPGPRSSRRRAGRQGPDQGRCGQSHVVTVDLRGRRCDRPGPADSGRDPRGSGVRRHLLRQQADPVDYGCIPSAVFSHPPLAGVGLTEGEAKQPAGPGQDLHVRLPRDEERAGGPQRALALQARRG